MLTMSIPCPGLGKYGKPPLQPDPCPSQASPRVLHRYTPSPQVPRCRSPPRCALDRSCWQRNRPRHCDLATVSRLDARARIVRTAHPQCTPHIAAVVLLRRSRAARIRKPRVPPIFDALSHAFVLRSSCASTVRFVRFCLHTASSRKRHQDRHQEQGHAAARAVVLVVLVSSLDTAAGAARPARAARRAHTRAARGSQYV